MLLERFIAFDTSLACEWVKKLIINYFMNFIATYWKYWLLLSWCCWWIHNIHQLMIVITIIKLSIPRSLETSFWHKYFNFASWSRYMIFFLELWCNSMCCFCLLHQKLHTKYYFPIFFCVRKLWDFCVVNYLLQQFYLMMSLRTFFRLSSSCMPLILSQCKMCEVTEFILMVQANNNACL